MDAMPHPEAPRRLARLTLVEGAYEALKSRLMDSDLAPGSKLNMEALGRELGVSPTPIREALAALEREGLVTKIPLVGYTATAKLDRAAFEELWEARLVLEPATVRLAALRATPPDLEAMASPLAVDLGAAGGTSYRDYRRIAQHDADFHAAIAAASQNPTLAEWWDRAHVHVHMYRLHFETGLSVATHDEHDRILRAIVAQDPEAAEAAMVEHLNRSRQRILVAFDD